MFGVHIHIGGGQLKDVSGLLPAEGVKIVAMVHQNDSYRLALEGGAHVDVTKDWVRKNQVHVGGKFLIVKDQPKYEAPVPVEPAAEASEPKHVPLAAQPGATVHVTEAGEKVLIEEGLPGPGELPSGSDLDSVAAEEKAKEATSAEGEADPAPQLHTGSETWLSRFRGQ